MPPPPAPPAAAPGAPRVENGQVPGVRRDDPGSGRRPGKHDAVAIVHVVGPQREHLPEQSPRSGAATPRGVEEPRVHRLDELVSRGRVEAAAPGLGGGRPELREHHRHAQRAVGVGDVRLHPRVHEPEPCLQSRARHPGVWVDVDGGEVDAQDAVVADEVGADLASIGVRVGRKP